MPRHLQPQPMAAADGQASPGADPSGHTGALHGALMPSPLPDALHLQVLTDVIDAFRDSDVADALGQVVAALCRLEGVAAAWVFLRGEGSTLDLAAHSAPGPLWHRSSLSLHGNTCGALLMRGGEAPRCNSGSPCTALCTELVGTLAPGCGMNVPLAGPAGVLGMLNVAFAPGDAEPALQAFVQVIGKQVGLGLSQLLAGQPAPVSPAAEATPSRQARDWSSIRTAIRWAEQATSFNEVQSRLPYLRRLVSQLEHAETSAPPRLPTGAMGHGAGTPVAPPVMARRVDGGSFSVVLPVGWSIAGEDVMVDGRQVRLHAQGWSGASHQHIGSLQIWTEPRQGRAFAEILRTARAAAAAEDPEVSAFAGNHFDRDGSPAGYTVVRRRDGHVCFDTTHLAVDDWQIYTMSITVAADQQTAATDLEIIHSFRLHPGSRERVS